MRDRDINDMDFIKTWKFSLVICNQKIAGLLKEAEKRVSEIKSRTYVSPILFYKIKSVVKIKGLHFFLLRY